MDIQMVSHETAALADNSLNTYVDISYNIYDGWKKRFNI